MAAIEETSRPTGERVRRKEGDLLLTGAGGFIEDVDLPGTLHAAFLRSPHAHADLLDIDLTAAREAPGVRMVLGGAEFAEYLPAIPQIADASIVGGKSAQFPALATDRVWYAGQPVAFVVADSRASAEAARDLITVRYALREPILDVERALEPGAPLVFEEWGTNVMVQLPMKSGDADGAFARAPRTLEGELKIQRYQTAPLETCGYVANWERDGRLTFYASVQNPHIMRTMLALMVDIPETEVRVVMPRVGGSFGSKGPGSPEQPPIVWASRLLNAPVKWVESREENLLLGARDYWHRFEVAYDEKGKILALKDRIAADIGSLGTTGGWAMSFVAGMTLPGPYKVADYDVEVSTVVTHKTPWSAARGFGKESATLVLERIIDMIADDLELDPADVRFQNFIPSDEFPYWVGAKRLDSGDYAGAMTQLLELGDYDGKRSARDAARRDGRLVGVGVAFELTPEGIDLPGSMARGYDTSTVRIAPSGAVTVLTGVTSPGTGNETGIAQIVAAELGIDIDKIRVAAGDTDVSPYGYGNFSSRSLTLGGTSALLAARELRENLGVAAAALLDVDPKDISFRDGNVQGPDGKVLSFTELVDTVYRFSFTIPGVELLKLDATCTWGPTENLFHTPDEHGRTSTYPSFPYSAHLAEVEIDPVTGVVRILDYACVHDCGVMINPSLVEGQVIGAIAMGIGGALWEELVYDDEGHLTTQTFKHYLTPRAPDLPTIRLGHQVTPSPFTPLGTKGAGESGVSGGVAVMASAVHDALRPMGIVIDQMPLSPDRLVAAMEQAR